MVISITGSGIIAARGVGTEQFNQKLFCEAPPPVPLSDLAGGQPVPEGAAHIVTGFDVGQIVGRRKGIRVLDRTSALAVAASHLALRDAGLTEADGERVGVVLGTGCGSQQSLYQFVQETYTADQPHQVSPEMFPRTVMNYAAGQIAIWFGLRALNTTISGGRLAGLLALRYGARVLRRGYADSVVAGSVQEFSPEGAWIAYHLARARGRRMPTLGEGGAMFVLGAGATTDRPRAELLACEVATAEGTDTVSQVKCLAGCIAAALTEAAVHADEIWAVVGRAADRPGLAGIETQALAMACPAHKPAHIVFPESSLGDTYCASTALQVGVLLALFDGRAPAQACGLVTSFSHTGTAGCALLRTSPTCK